MAITTILIFTTWHMYHINNAITTDIMLTRTMQPAIITIGYDIGCPNDKVHTSEYCDGYPVGYMSKWNLLAGGTSTQQSQSQAQGASIVRVDSSHNNIIIAPRQNQLQSSNSKSNADYSK